MSGTIINAKNPSNVYQPLNVDASGRLECSVNEIEITAGDIVIAVDGLEALQTATKNALFTNPLGSGNTIGENASAINQNLITNNNKLDDIITNTGASSSAGLASESTLASIDGKITACNTGAVVISSSALPSGSSTSTLQGGGLPSALSGDNLKVSLKETISVPITHSTLTNLDNTINSNRVDVNIANGNISGFSTATLQGGGLPSALSTDNLKVSLKETISVPVTHTTLTNLDNTINSNRVDVNIANGNISGFSTASLQGAGLPSALSLDNLKVSLKETISVPVTHTTLTNLDNTINSNRVDVNIANGNISGFSTATLQGAGLPSALSSDNLKVSLKESIAVGVTNAGLTALDSAIGLNKVNVNLAQDAVGLSTSALQGDLNTKIDTIDSQIDLLEGTNTIKDVEWLNGATISDQALSDVLDTEGYERVFIYGENSGSISGNTLKIFGSNLSAGTYYSVGQMSVITSDSGRYLIREDTPVADMPSPRYLKVFNATGSSQTITKLRAVMSHKLRYV